MYCPPKNHIRQTASDGTEYYIDAISGKRIYENKSPNSQRFIQRYSPDGIIYYIDMDSKIPFLTLPINTSSTSIKFTTHRDETSGKVYYYNTESGETSFDDPLSRELSPPSNDSSNPLMSLTPMVRSRAQTTSLPLSSPPLLSSAKSMSNNRSSSTGPPPLMSQAHPPSSQSKSMAVSPPPLLSQAHPSASKNIPIMPPPPPLTELPRTADSSKYKVTDEAFFPSKPEANNTSTSKKKVAASRRTSISLIPSSKNSSGEMKASHGSKTENRRMSDFNKPDLSLDKAPANLSVIDTHKSVAKPQQKPLAVADPALKQSCNEENSAVKLPSATMSLQKAISMQLDKLKEENQPVVIEVVRPPSPVTATVASLRKEEEEVIVVGKDVNVKQDVDDDEIDEIAVSDVKPFKIVSTVVDLNLPLSLVCNMDGLDASDGTPDSLSDTSSAMLAAMDDVVTKDNVVLVAEDIKDRPFASQMQNQCKLALEVVTNLEHALSIFVRERTENDKCVLDLANSSCGVIDFVIKMLEATLVDSPTMKEISCLWHYNGTNSAECLKAVGQIRDCIRTLMDEDDEMGDAILILDKLTEVAEGKFCYEKASNRLQTDLERRLMYCEHACNPIAIRAPEPVEQEQEKEAKLDNMEVSPPTTAKKVKVRLVAQSMSRGSRITLGIDTPTALEIYPMISAHDDDDVSDKLDSPQDPFDYEAFSFTSSLNYGKPLSINQTLSHTFGDSTHHVPFPTEYQTLDLDYSDDGPVPFPSKGKRWHSRNNSESKRDERDWSSSLRSFPADQCAKEPKGSPTHRWFADNPDDDLTVSTRTTKVSRGDSGSGVSSSIGRSIKRNTARANLRNSA